MTRKTNIQQDLNGGSPLAPNGVEWWKPGATYKERPIGRERRLAAFLWFQVSVGELFTMRVLRDELGEGSNADNSEQLNRRLRALRKDGWIIPSYKDDRTLPPDTYRLVEKGKRIWLGELREQVAISQKTRRLVFERDGSRCVLCGVGGGEPYPGDPQSHAKLTVGHRFPGERKGKLTMENLWTECARCNEPLRHELPDPESLDEVLAEVRTLKKVDLQELYNWMRAGARSRSKLDRVFDRARMLAHPERQRLINHLSEMLGMDTSR